MVLKAHSQLVEIVAVLVQKFQVTKVIVFGSFVKNRFTAKADIDIAVEGVKKKNFFLAESKVNPLIER